MLQFLALVFLASACTGSSGDPGGATDGGSADGGSTDGGTTDGGGADGGDSDGGDSDGGGADGGDSDGGGGDGGTTDGGEADGGATGVYTVPDSPIVVFWTIDALSGTAARATDLCGKLRSQLQAYGLELTCLDGAVTPSSWTIESHVRLFWPTHTFGEKRASIVPDCDDRPYLSVIADHYDGAYFFGAENSKFGQAADLSDCGGGVSSWTDDADQAWITPDITPKEQAEVPLSERPPWLALGALLEESEKGRAVTTFLNDFEAGGHMPRCWWEPDSEACARIYDLAVSLGVVSEDTTPYDAFLAPGFWQDLQEFTRDTELVQSDTLVADFNASITEQVSGLWEQRTQQRLARLLDGLQAQGRLDDLVLVVTGDHGEAPCAPQVLTDERDCSHGHIPSEWTADVPLMISPPQAAEQLIADGWLPADGTPFSSMRITYGLTDLLTGGIPSSWPEAEPIGEATSWVCFEHTVNRNRLGLKLLGDQTMRCTAAGCGFYSWDVPVTDIELGPRELARSEISTELMAFAEATTDYPSWFTKVCVGEATD